MTDDFVQAITFFCQLTVHLVILWGFWWINIRLVAPLIRNILKIRKI